MQNLFDLTGKDALITGGSRGIGYLLAGGVGRHGASIIVSATTAENAERGAKISRAIEQLEQLQGPIDILINNAGIQRRHPLLTFPEAD